MQGITRSGQPRREGLGIKTRISGDRRPLGRKIDLCRDYPRHRRHRRLGPTDTAAAMQVVHTIAQGDLCCIARHVQPSG